MEKSTNSVNFFSSGDFVLCFYLWAMIESDLVLKLFALEGKPDYRLIFNEELLHPLHDEIYINDINSILIELQQISKGTFNYKKQKKTDSIVMYHTLERIRLLENYDKFLHHPVHINEFTKKSGTLFLQARTNIKDSQNNTTKRFCLYVGNNNEFPKGSNSIEAYHKGRNLVRKALEPFFNLK